MTWSRLSLARLLLLGLLAPLAAANTDAKAEVRADPPPAGSGDGLAYEPIDKGTVYAQNTTATPRKTPPVEGWWESKICEGEYCIYTNRRMAKGRGIVLVTKHEEYQKMDRLEEHFERGENKYFEDPVPFEEVQDQEQGVLIRATKAIRRGKPLMSWTPVLIVHQSLFDDIPRKKDRIKLLEAAVAFLPDATREKFDKQRLRPGDPANLNPRSIEEILRAAPFEIDLGYMYRREENSKHYVNYPEVFVLQHDCRPNAAYHLDESFAIRVTVARRIPVGEPITIAYINPLTPREERISWVKRRRGNGKKGCTCSACSPKGGNEEIAKADKRLEEILELRGELRNHDSTKVDFDLIERYLKLVEEDRLHAKFAEAYELAALNYNYLGDDKKAKKYADMAVQAGIVEGGVKSNDVVAMRIMASDIKGHYSYRYTLKRRGKVPKK
jgi:hypothetical protein